MRTSRNIFIAISLGWPGKQVAVGRRAAVRRPQIIGWAKGVSAINVGRRVEVNRSTTRPTLSDKVINCPGKEHEIWRRQNPNREVAENHNTHWGWRLSSSVSVPNNNSRSNDWMLWRGLSVLWLALNAQSLRWSCVSIYLRNPTLVDQVKGQSLAYVISRNNDRPQSLDVFFYRSFGNMLHAIF